MSIENVPTHEDEGISVESETTVVNEFTGVTVRKLLTRNGERLEIESLRLGFRIRLDALGLEALSWQDTETVSGWLSTPFGPSDADTPEPILEENA